MTIRELVIPFQRNKRSKSVTTAGRPAGRPLILTFLRYIEVDSLRASRSARNNYIFFSIVVFSTELEKQHELSE